MYGVGSSEAILRDTSILFSPTFKHSSEFMNSDLYEQNSSLTRYRSAPSSFFESLVHGDGCDNFLNAHQSSTPESESMFARLLSSDGTGDSEPHDLQFPTAVKHEIQEQNQYSTPPSSQMIYQSSLDHPDLTNHSNSVSNLEGLYKVENGSEMENQVQGKVSVANCSNLIRQSSSPPVFFSDLTAENGFAIMRDAGDFRVANGTNVKVSPTKRLNDHMNFSSGPSSCSRFMPQIAENRNESNSPENSRSGNGNGRNGFYSTGFQNETWNDSKITGLKRDKDAEEKFSGFNALESQNASSRNYTGLTHHLSLPKTSAEMAAIEKYLQFQQESVPCKIRAKRGCATHPRSIAERMRRTRISERMKKLQDLFPNMDKQTNTADMLDLAVEYIKDLQKQVKTLTDKRAKCTCSIKQKQISSPPA